jgi:hypothetical protein
MIVMDIIVRMMMMMMMIDHYYPPFIHRIASKEFIASLHVYFMHVSNPPILTTMLILPYVLNIYLPTNLSI